MRIALLTPSGAGPAAFRDGLAAALAAQGHAVARIDLADADPERFCRAASGADAAGDAGRRIAHARLAAFRPTGLVVLAAAAAAEALAPLAARVAELHLLAPAPGGRARLTALGQGRRRDYAAGETARAAAAILADIASAAGIPEGAIDPGGPEAEALAAAATAFRAATDRAPALARALRTDRAGAVEAPVEGEVLGEDRLWVKGWVEGEGDIAALVLRIGAREWRLPPAGFRHDIHAAGRAVRPVGFAAEVDIGHAATRGALTLQVEDAAGRRRNWRSRGFWVSRAGPVAGATPLVRAAAGLEGGRIACRLDADGTPPERIAAWQDGALLATWGPGGPTAGGAALLDVAGTMAGPGLIHLHAVFNGRPPLAVAAIDPATGAAPARIAATRIVDDARLDPGPATEGLALPEGPLRLFLDGKPAGAWHPEGGPRAPRALDHAAGCAFLEIAGETGPRRTIRLLQVRRRAAEGGGLPAIVLPLGPASLPPVPAGAPPRVVLIRQNAAPTDEIYVLSGLAARAAAGEIDLRIVDLATDARGPRDRDALLCRGAFVIVSRYLSDPWIEALGRLRSRLAGLVYLIDDDVTLAAGDTEMPPPYRRRMTGVAQSEFQAMLHLCSRLVVTSDFLAERFASDRTDLLTPAYIRPCTDLEHLDDLSEIRIEYHGTQVHRADLDAVAAALVHVHDAYPQVRIRTFMGRSAPARLQGLDRVEIVPDMPWEAYRARVAAARAHIALAPMLGTPYNRAKSFVKVMDIARLGAAGLYSRIAPYAGVVTHGEDGLLLETDAEVWRYALKWLIETPEEIRRLARGGQALAHRLSEAHHPRAYWADHLPTAAAGATV